VVGKWGYKTEDWESWQPVGCRAALSATVWGCGCLYIKCGFYFTAAAAATTGSVAFKPLATGFNQTL